MKKSILIMALAIALGTTTSCNKKEETTKTATEHEGHNHKVGEEHKVAYECPMDCEKGKTYDEKGMFFLLLLRVRVRLHDYALLFRRELLLYVLLLKQK